MTYLLIFFIYFIVLVSISLYANTHNKNKIDYLLGGRRLGMLTTSISAGASDMSAWLFLGLPGAVYLYGINQIWLVIGLCMGAYLNWKFVAYNLRKMSESKNNITIPDFIASNIIGNDKLVRIFSTITIIIFFTIYVASGFTAGGVLLSSLLGIDFTYAMLITVLCIVSYVFIGGYLAVAWTDLMQGLLMILIIFAVPMFALSKIDFDLSYILNNILQYNKNAFNIFYNTSFISVVSLLAWGLGYFGQPHILSKFMGIKNPEDLRQARRINIAWTSFGMIFACIVGLLASGYFYSAPLINPEKAIVQLAKSTAPVFLVAMVFVAILSAIVSTANSQLLVVASSVVEDINIKFKVSSTLLGRISILLISVLAIFLSIYSKSSILVMVGYAWAGFGASFGPLILIITKGVKPTNIAALSGILVGAIVVIIWKNLSGGIFDLYEILPAFILSFFSIIIVNKVSKKK